MLILKLEFCKKDIISGINNININEGVVDPIVNKPELVTLSYEDVYDVYFHYKQLESSMKNTPDK